MPAPVRHGAEPFSAAGGATGVLVLHGFTGSPASMRPLAEAFAAAGHTVELPRLPGHGTAVEDVLDLGWDDWFGAATAAADDLAGRCDRLVVVGLSMGGTLAATLAATRDDVAGAVLVNPAVAKADAGMVDLLQGMVDSGTETMDAIGNDIAKEGADEVGYDATPIRALLEVLGASDRLVDQLGSITCPVLLFTSRQDHVVDPTHSDTLAAAVTGPVERVHLERSYHVATLDHDADDIAAHAVDFVAKLAG